MFLQPHMHAMCPVGHACNCRTPLTLWLLVCFQTKTSSLHMALHGTIYSAITLQSCSSPQKTWVYNENNFFVFGFFVSDITSGVVLGPFGPLHLVLGPNR